MDWILPGDNWPTFAGVIHLVISLACTAHAVLHKREPRAATGWVGIIWLVPVIGVALYLLFGINRIARVARSYRSHAREPVAPDGNEAPAASSRVGAHDGLDALARLGATLTRRPLLPGNRVTPLENGDEAYPRMLAAIRGAESFVTLSTYIFDNDRVGGEFIEALCQAAARSVRVRVLIDDVGLRYSWRPVHRLLARRGVTVARFMGALRPRTFPHLNLRKHRKILVCDGKVAFTGGMNIREGHVLGASPPHPVQDLHFEIEGPLVGQLQETFIDDWAFTTGELLDGPEWGVSREAPAAGPTLARAITDGPDDDLNKLSLMIAGGISAARESVWILTPYFLPDTGLQSALYVAAGKGVAVNIVLPEENNLKAVKWASYPLLLPLLEHGCRLWFSKPPFDHTKLMLVDGAWALFGSANIDPRSLRLNFELSVEAYDPELGARLMALITKKLGKARPVTEAELRSRPLALRLRDGAARLFSPYL